jgi:hypothetical protein
MTATTPGQQHRPGQRGHRAHLATYKSVSGLNGLSGVRTGYAKNA